LTEDPYEFIPDISIPCRSSTHCDVVGELVHQLRCRKCGGSSDVPWYLVAGWKSRLLTIGKSLQSQVDDFAITARLPVNICRESFGEYSCDIFIFEWKSTVNSAPFTRILDAG